MCESILGKGNSALSSRSTLQESSHNSSTPLANGQSELKLGSQEIEGHIQGLVKDVFWLEYEF